MFSVVPVTVALDAGVGWTTAVGGGWGGGVASLQPVVPNRIANEAAARTLHLVMRYLLTIQIYALWPGEEDHIRWSPRLTIERIFASSSRMSTRGR